MYITSMYMYVFVDIFFSCYNLSYNKTIIIYGRVDHLPTIQWYVSILIKNEYFLILKKVLRLYHQNACIYPIMYVYIKLTWSYSEIICLFLWFCMGKILIEYLVSWNHFENINDIMNRLDELYSCKSFVQFRFSVLFSVFEKNKS